jgi:hypothetical protein
MIANRSSNRQLELPEQMIHLTTSKVPKIKLEKAHQAASSDGIRGPHVQVVISCQGAELFSAKKKRTACPRIEFV